MAKLKATQAQIEQRRAKVSANILAGNNYRTIAAGLGVSVGTVTADVKAIFKQWEKEAVSNLNEAIILELGRLDIAQAAIWPNVREGNTRAIDTLIKIMTHRARLLGIDDPPRKVDVSSNESGIVIYIPENDR